MSLRPVIRPACPRCGWNIRYHVRDERMPVTMWVMTEESRKHLAYAECDPPVAEVIPLYVLPRSQPQAA